jgi:catechol 2,3-dioxygenase-like lactoylglutathione lyase family enzyme
MSDGLGTDVLTQVAMIVRDIEATAAAWADVLGVDAPEVIVTDAKDVSNIRYRGAETDGRAKLAFFRLGQVSIELIEPVGGPSTWQEFLDAHGEGVHHVAFNVPDMDGAVAYLAGKGMELVQRGDYTGGCYSYIDSTEKLKVMLELLASTAE